MEMDKKGFSLIELLAIIVITSVIIVPLMTTFVNFFEINNRMHDRRNAVGIADVAQNSVNRLNFLELKTELDSLTGDYMMLTMVDNGTTIGCNFAFVETASQKVCDLIFSLEYNNMTIPLGDMEIYFLDYNLTDTVKQAINDDPTLHQEVKDAIAAIPANNEGAAVASIMRYVVYVKYSDDPRGVIVLDGVVIQ